MNNNTNTWNTELQVDYETIFRNWKKDNQLYIQLPEINKQEYWDRYTFTIWWYDQRWTSLPINIKKLREQYKWVEDNFDRFLPWIMQSLEEEWFTWATEDIFLLDEQAIRYLEWEEVEWVMNLENVSEIKLEDKELAIKLWDLFYEPLASILDWISRWVKNEEISRLLKDASSHVLKAWDHCKPFVTNIKELEKKSKHTFNIVETWLSNEQLSSAISNLGRDKLKELLSLLSKKLENDAEADKWRGRLKLAWELFETSVLIKKASEVL